MNTKVKILAWLVVILVIFGACAQVDEETEPPITPTHMPIVEVDEDSLIPATIHEPGWSTPIKLGFNDAGWEDSPYITRDGSRILFFYHPWPDLAEPGKIEELTEYVLSNQQEAIQSGLDGKIYVSYPPFNEREIHPVSQSKIYPTADSSAYISESGDIFYVSNKESYLQKAGVPVTVYRNGQRLDFGTGEDEGNPHYCEALDEIWFDCPSDQNICIMKDAQKNGFQAGFQMAPSPINHLLTDVTDFQPFLTDDCQTLYFSSTRGEDRLIAIYKTTREGDSWSEPVVFISHPGGVAELSMTSDGDEMIFVQVFWQDYDSPRTDIWYSKFEN